MNLNRIDLPKHLSIMDNTIDLENKKQMQEDGAIFTDTERAKELGFTSDLFHGYLWEDEGRVWISFIYSKKPKQGNCTTLIRKLLDEYKGVLIPSPSQAMTSLCLNLKSKGVICVVTREDGCNFILLKKKKEFVK